MFNLAIDSKLRGCDFVALGVDDVAPNGDAIDRANVRQRKTGRSVRFEVTEPTRQALDDDLRHADRKPGVVDHQIELDRLLDGEIGRFLALEDFVDDRRAAPLQFLRNWRCSA